MSTSETVGEHRVWREGHGSGSQAPVWRRCSRSPVTRLREGRLQGLTDAHTQMWTCKCAET